MQTQTVQNSPLLSGNTAASRSSNAAQGDQQFAQALNNQIERQANALPPSAQQQAPAPAPRRAEAPKPAQPQPQASQQAARPNNGPAPANKPAAQSQAPAKAQQNSQSAQSNEAQDASADGAQAEAPATGGKGNATASGTASASASAADQSDDKKVTSDAVADMLAMIQGYGQPAATDAAAAAAAAAAASKDGHAADATLASDAVLDGKAGKSGAESKSDGLPVDQATLLAAKATAESAAAGRAAANEQDPDLTDALAKLGHGAAADSDKTATKPDADFQAALQQASADGGKAAELAARDSKQTIQPQASALQAAAAALAPAGAANAQAAQAVASNQLHARVGSQGWDQQLGQKVVWMVNGGEQSATLTLNPPDLGPLQVVLSVSNDQASVTFTAAQPEVRQALEQALPKLRETMGEAGISLGNTSVSAGSQEQQQAFAEMASGGRGRGVANGQIGNGGDGESSAQPAPQVRRSILSAVDTFA
jgi:flagellar hook-length control protein FliK